MTVTRAPQRALWSSLPAALREEAERRLGTAALGERSQTGGFTPGVASRLDLADGRRVFVKAIAADHELVDAYRAESTIAGCLPTGSPAPALWWAVERDGWVLSAFDDIDGRHPDLAPGSADLPAVIDAVASLGETLTPCPYEAAPTAAAEFGPLFGGWATLAADPPPDLDDWSRRHLEALAAHESSCLDAMVGDTLLHNDLRDDNLMIDSRSGRVLVIDWAWPARGAAWVDVAFLVPQLVRAGHDPAGAEALLAEVAGWQQADPAAVTSYAVAVTGLWERDWRTSTSAGLRDYRAAAAAAGRRWVAHRTGWR